jgi:predicted TIM-barrel fold metal-dependent hydrolase
MHAGVKVLDVHGHVSTPPAANAFLATMVGINSPIANPFAVGVADAAVGGSRDRELQFRPAYEDLPDAHEFRRAAEAHVAYLDRRQIDVQVVGPRPFIVAGWTEPHLTLPWAQYMNDAIAYQCSMFPERFKGACQLPQRSEAPDTMHCLEELERCVEDHGFVATYAIPDPGGRRETPGMHEPYWYPLYEYCEAADVPIIVHGTTSFDRRLRVIPHNYQISFVVEQYIAMQCLRWSDVFDRYPGLKVIICHCGSVLERFVDDDPIHISPKDLSSNLFFDTCAYNDIFLAAAIKQRGVSQMCFGSETPGSGSHARKDPNARPADDLVPLIDGFDFLTADEKRELFHDNVVKVVPRIKPVA